MKLRHNRNPLSLFNRPAAGARAEASIDPTARPAIKVNATDTTAELFLYSEIGYWGITAGQFAEAMNQHRGKAITLRINSPGGDVFDGLAMYSLLSTWPTQVTAQIDGLAASAASIVMLGADTVQMVKGSFVMIHNAWGVAIGNASDLRDFAGVLDQIDANLADLYAAKSGMTPAKALEYMAAETWFNADQALEAKLIDSVVDGNVANARLDRSLYRNTPSDLPAKTDIDTSEDAHRRMQMRLELVRRSA